MKTKPVGEMIRTFPLSRDVQTAATSEALSIRAS